MQFGKFKDICQSEGGTRVMLLLFPLYAVMNLILARRWDVSFPGKQLILSSCLSMNYAGVTEL